MAPRTIRLKGVGERMERPAGGAITPGHLVMLTASNTLVVHNLAGQDTPPLFALENELFGKGIDDAYVANDLVQAEHFSGGDWAYAWIAAGVTITRGELLESAGDGTLRIVGAAMDYANAVAQAMESVTAGGSAARIMVAVL